MGGRVSEALLSVLLGIYLEMELPDPVVIVLHSLRMRQSVFQWLPHFMF